MQQVRESPLHDSVSIGDHLVLVYCAEYKSESKFNIRERALSECIITERNVKKFHNFS